MYRTIAQIKDWDEVLNLITNLINENKQLKVEKQQLVNKLMNLKLQTKQDARQKGNEHIILISEMQERRGV